MFERRPTPPDAAERLIEPGPPLRAFRAEAARSLPSRRPRAGIGRIDSGFEQFPLAL